MGLPPAPLGQCTCLPMAPEPCDYCTEMELWAHSVLYGEEEEAIDHRRDYGPSGDEEEEEEE